MEPNANNFENLRNDDKAAELAGGLPIENLNAANAELSQTREGIKDDIEVRGVSGDQPVADNQAQAFDPSSLPQPVQPQVQNDGAATLQDDVSRTDAGSLSEEKERIEKEWVDKSKDVVSRTKNDPYEQDREVSRLQAEYLRQRFGKIIKQPEE